MVFTEIKNSAELKELLFSFSDIKYKSFQLSLIPGYECDRMIGIRVPILRKIASGISKTEYAKDFLNTLPHEYYEEYLIHAFLINGLRSYSQTIDALEAFLPHVDNWACCDALSPASFKKNDNKEDLTENIKRWLKSERAYTVRFAVGMMMKFFLDDAFTPEFPELASKIKSDEYYINMMIGWYFATGLAKRYSDFVTFLENRLLSPAAHNMTVRKARESFRISNEQKEYLKSLKI